MKARPEDKRIRLRGVIITAETDEEKEILFNIWHDHGAPVAFGRLEDGNFELTVSPTTSEVGTGT